MYPRLFEFCGVYIRKFYTFFLALSIFLGFSAGVYVVHTSCADFSSLMSFTSCNASIVGTLIVVFFPFLLTLCFLRFSKRYMLFILCFARCFLLGYCTWGVFVSIGGGGWLYSFLYFFVGYSTLPFDIWLWIRCLDTGCIPKSGDFLGYLSLVGISLLLNELLITPLLNLLAEI